MVNFRLYCLKIIYYFKTIVLYLCESLSFNGQNQGTSIIICKPRLATSFSVTAQMRKQDYRSRTDRRLFFTKLSSPDSQKPKQEN